MLVHRGGCTRVDDVVFFFFRPSPLPLQIEFCYARKSATAKCSQECASYFARRGVWFAVSHAAVTRTSLVGFVGSDRGELLSVCLRDC
jgi:hypothetical protein